jgi:hypothetical protein
VDWRGRSAGQHERVSYSGYPVQLRPQGSTRLPLSSINTVSTAQAWSPLRLATRVSGSIHHVVPLDSTRLAAPGQRFVVYSVREAIARSPNFCNRDAFLYRSIYARSPTNMAERHLGITWSCQQCRPTCRCQSPGKDMLTLHARSHKNRIDSDNQKCR